MGTGALFLHLSATLSTTVGIVGMAPITPDGKGDISYQQEITDIIEREDAEDHIDDGTDSSKS